MTHAYLRRIQECYPQIDYYMKSYGFTSKYWDGYSNEVAVIVDDPAKPQQFKIDAISECWKNILSGSQFLANQKYGGIQFDSHLCIILANISARELAESFAHEEVSAHYHRFADSMGEYYVGSTEYLQAFFNEVFVQRYWKLLSWRQLITDD